MKKYKVRVQIVEDGTGEVLSQIDYGLDDYPDDLTEWVEGEMEERWEQRLKPEVEF